MDLNEARDDGGFWGWQWHQLDHMQTICTLLQTDNHINTSSINFIGRMLFPAPNQQCQNTVKAKRKVRVMKINQSCLSMCQPLPLDLLNHRIYEVDFYASTAHPMSHQRHYVCDLSTHLCMPRTGIPRLACRRLLVCI